MYNSILFIVYAVPSVLHNQSVCTEIKCFGQLDHIFFSINKSGNRRRKLKVGHISYISIMKELSDSLATLIPT